MKTMTCKQLGGPEGCEKTFTGETWDEIKQQSMEHGKAMMEAGDQSHLAAGQAMREKMQDPGAFENWMKEKEAEFNALPDDE